MNDHRERRPSRPMRGRPAPRKEGPRRPPEVDPARQAAFDVLRAVREKDAYANLVLPDLLRERRISGRDAALATELTYGTLRAAGPARRDHRSRAPSGRWPRSDPAVLDALRLGAYQLLRARIPAPATVTSNLDLVPAEDRSVGHQFAEHDPAQGVRRGQTVLARRAERPTRAPTRSGPTRYAPRARAWIAGSRAGACGTRAPS